MVGNLARNRIRLFLESKFKKPFFFFESKSYVCEVKFHASPTSSHFYFAKSWTPNVWLTAKLRYSVQTVWISMVTFLHSWFQIFLLGLFFGWLTHQGLNHVQILAKQYICVCGGFLSHGGPQNGEFIMEHPTKKYIYIYTYIYYITPRFVGLTSSVIMISHFV